MKYDFSGWATKNDLRCSDGRTIRKNAFAECDGTVVPLVWNHKHNEPANVLGHALLENREEGVYTYGFFNDSESGKNAKSLVMHGDITGLSIYANQLKQNGGDVLHGAIREVSLVLTGANPGAFIDDVVIHSDNFDGEAIIYPDLDIALYHSDEEETEEPEGSDEETIQDIFDSLSEDQKKAAYAIIGAAVSGKGLEEDVQHAEGATVAEVFETFSDKQKKAVYAIVGMLMEQEDSDEEVEHSDINENEEDYEGGSEELMKHNAFSGAPVDVEENALSHAEIEEVFNDARRYGSLKDSVLAHGITDIEYLFPDAQNLENTPGWIRRKDDWVSVVMKGVHHTPFSRIKSMFADLTEDEARARGYIKGKLKKEEVFSLLKRTTTPTTIYKKQKLDRDDVIDITDFDVVAWMKTEMRWMLDEEIARAILVGDGRLASSDDHIPETNIRPIWKDEALYTVNKVLPAGADPKDVIKGIIRAHKDYRGSGNTTFFTTEDMLTEMLLIEDVNGRVIYDTEEKLATALRVRRIQTVPVMENLSRVVEGETRNLIGIIVDLDDYVVGADKGGAVSMFDDFDIDLNAQKYLIETRCSGAMRKPFGAIAIEMVAGGIA